MEEKVYGKGGEIGPYEGNRLGKRRKSYRNCLTLNGRCAGDERKGAGLAEMGEGSVILVQED